MDEKLYSEAMTTLDTDMEMFGLVADSIKAKTDDLLYTKTDYEDFYNILKNKKDYTDETLRHIIGSNLGVVTIMVALWADICKDKNKKIDKEEFCNTFLTQYSGE